MRLIAATGLMLLFPAAGIAADRYHVVTTSFGCVVPWTTWALNGRNPHRHDRRWLDRIAARGGCRLVSPIVEWERVGRIGRLVLMRQVPPLVGATPLLFRPSDMRVGGIADPAPAPAAAPGPAPAPATRQDPPPAAATAAAPSGPAGPPTAPPVAPSVAPPLPPASAAPGPPSPAASAPDTQANRPAGSDAASPPASVDPAAHEPAPATSPPDAQAVAPVGSDAVPSPAPSDPATREPAVAVPSSTGSAAATAPVAPAPDAAALPAPPPSTPPSTAMPATAAPDAGIQPSAVSPARPDGTLAATAGSSPRNRVLIAVVALLALLAAVVVLGLRLLLRRGLGGTAGQPSAELYDARPDDLADQAGIPQIDGNAYRQWCVDSLTEAGWQARMGFPAGRLTADIMARRDGRLLTVQCRPSMRPLEADVVQEALVVRRAQDAQIAAVVSNAGYTRAARNLAAASGVRLLHETELTEFVS